MTHRPSPDASDLTWLIDALWGSGAEIVGSPPPSGEGSSYLITPTRRRPRMLLPDNRTAARVALRAGTGMRSAAAGRRRALLARVLATDTGWHLARDRLWVRGRDALREGFEEALGGPVLLAAAMRIRTPFRKPMLQVLRPGGQVIAYAKVAWNEVTAENVRAEHEALGVFAEARHLDLRTPDVVTVFEHRGFPVLVTRPMPDTVRRYRAEEGPPAATLSRRVSDTLGGMGPSEPIRRRLRARLDASRVDADGAAWVTPVAEAAAVVLDGVDTRGLPTGAWHGDWAPWNLGHEDDALWVWDWEQWRLGVPVGLDVPHFIFQQRFIAHRRSLADAFASTRVESSPLLASLGYDEGARRAVHAIHVLEICLRYLEADRYGVPANPRFVAGALEALRAAHP